MPITWIPRFLKRCEARKRGVNLLRPTRRHLPASRTAKKTNCQEGGGCSTFKSLRVASTRPCSDELECLYKTVVPTDTLTAVDVYTGLNSSPCFQRYCRESTLMQVYSKHAFHFSFTIFKSPHSSGFIAHIRLLGEASQNYRLVVWCR